MASSYTHVLSSVERRGIVAGRLVVIALHPVSSLLHSFSLYGGPGSLLLVVPAVLGHFVLVVPAVLGHFALVVPAVLGHFVLVVPAVLGHFVLVVPAVLGHFDLVVPAVICS